jgi:hypothetical protein
MSAGGAFLHELPVDVAEMVYWDDIHVTAQLRCIHQCRTAKPRSITRWPAHAVKQR